ncbi:MAG: PAS domain S-box protein [Bdellovibrionales bacterium]|nr:PAS domain S-box protein [Bdellovibrionales bacterium]
MPILTQSLIKKLEDQKYALDQAAIVASTDAKGVIIYVNDKFCEVSGYNREELLGKTHRIVNSGSHPKEFFIDLWKTIASGKVWRGEVCNRKKNGDLYWVYTTIVPFLGDDGKISQYLSIRYEITDLKKAQQTILEQQEKLVAASRLSAIGEMAAAITHEINNPLGVILGRVEMLKSMLNDPTLDKEELFKVADTIEVTGQRIAKIVRSMKTMAHHSQEQELSAKVPVLSLIEDALDLCQHRFKNHGVDLKTPVIDPNLIIDCRSHQIVQVLVNLLNNSFDAVQQLPQKWVKIELQEHEHNIDIIITDSGAGIPEEVQKKMFNPFFSTKSVQYGTGLGLSISVGIIHKNGGSLQYDRKSPHTRFVIQLPKKLPKN